MERTCKRASYLSPAKINLGLDIQKRLPDGYHEVRMVMQTLDLCDTVSVCVQEPASSGEHAVTLSCPGSGLPEDERNLAFRAAELLREEFDLRCDIGIVIDKRIPVAAGLAGGSGNAAAVLRALNDLCALGLSLEELCARGKSLGADVPYCLMQGTVLAEGIGERLTPLPDLTEGCVLLVKPAVSVATGWAYETWDLTEDPFHPDIDALAACMKQGGARDRFLRAADLLGNSFEPVIFSRYAVVAKIRETMLALGAAGALMSGSGPTVFGLFADDQAMAAAAEKMRELYQDAFVAQTHIRGKESHVCTR